MTTIEHAEGDDAPGFGTGAKLGKLSFPTLSPGNAALAFLGTATTANTVAIFAPNRIVAKGDAAAGVSGAHFMTLHDPVAGQSGHLAFAASLEKGGTPKITAANNDGIWAFNPTDGLTLIAREGAQPADIAQPTAWKKFTSLATTADGRPLFVASIRTKRGTDTGLWATDSLGALRLLLRKGDAIGDSKVKTFVVLSSVLGSAAQTRSFNNNGSVIVRVTDSKSAQHLLRIAVP